MSIMFVKDARGVVVVLCFDFDAYYQCDYYQGALARKKNKDKYRSYFRIAMLSS